MGMREFDKIIGYESIRKEMERTADALKNPRVLCAARGFRAA